ncbi:HNH endonuclease signature motif containing protein [Mangrovibacterium lignilyticum]|uniref:HNH endonuclease signature motif containing protein n=1 Tax=Mangrovibacterium lignilyticum TaxID=2668052 RepID=UPI0013D316CA|nr:HNH endonuclease signature motif containing protein [Mangrovibacterium lignilyticum]
MVRNYNTDKEGNSWSEETKRAVWDKGRNIPEFAPDQWRWDVAGKVMKYDDYGDRQSEYGWEIDHIDPVANGGTDDISNLQPLTWKHNTHKGDILDWTVSKG